MTERKRGMTERKRERDRKEAKCDSKEAERNGNKEPGVTERGGNWRDIG